jgi:hypothetical protein
VHQDGTEGALITMFSRHNVQADSAESQLWKLAQPSGKCAVEDLESDNLLTRKVLRDPFDILMFFDRFLKHDVEAFYAENTSKDAQRNVMVAFARRPFKDGSDFERHVEPAVVTPAH